MSANTLARTCRDAEDSGAAALWAVDHLFWPRPLLECLTVLGVAATATTHATIGSCVLQLPMRSPAAVAKQAATLQLLTEGRLVLGLGLGSHPGEYAEAGADYRTRGLLLDRGIDALRRSWRGEGLPASPYRQHPSPPPIPIWIGGSSGAARRRAATVGDGWVPLFVDPAAYGTGLRRLREEAAGAGRDPADLTAAVVVFVHVGPRPRAAERGTAWLSSLYGLPPRAFDRHLVAGPATACAARVQAYLDAGAEHVAVMVAADDVVDHFGELVGALQPAGGGSVHPGTVARQRVGTVP